MIGTSEVHDFVPLGEVVMADTIDTFMSETTMRMPPLQHRRVAPRLWEYIALGAVLLLSIFMNFFQLGQNGYGNLYYAAGVRSMSDRDRKSVV